MSSTDRLAAYRDKRDLQASPEPDGSAPEAERDGMPPRFVMQEHHASRLHWDLRLEHDGVLWSWALPNGIPFAPKENRLAVKTEDHPLAYLTFAGDIPAGQYGAGRMWIFDAGTFDIHEFGPQKVEVTLAGDRVRGRYGLFPLHRDGGPRHEWMIHRMQPPTHAAWAPAPTTLAPMLARAGDLPSGDQWTYEVKWDGVRALAFGRPGRLTLRSRNGADITDGYPELRALRAAIGHHDVILDGEIVALDREGRPSFERLARRMHVREPAQVKRLAAEIPVVYVIFDVLWYDGHALTDLTYAERRERLAQLGLEGKHWQVPAPVDDGTALLEVTREQGLEGVVAKRRDGRYLPGRRSADWIKVAHVQREQVVIVGWLPGQGRRARGVGSVVVAVDDHGELRYAGRVGTGWTEDQLDALTTQLAAIECADGAVADARIPSDVRWVQPAVTLTVAFRHWTADGVMRAPSVQHVGEVETPQLEVSTEAVAEVNGADVRVGERTVTLTNLSKVLYPETGWCKRDVLTYLAAIAPVALGHYAGRPMTRIRFPDGVDGTSFYEKQAPSHTPEWVRTVAVDSRRSGSVDYVVVDELATLIWLGNLAALELHPSLHRAETPDTPDTIVFDLDPGPPATIVQCCEVALLLRGMLKGLGLQAFAKTSGRKGLQLSVPLNLGEASYDATKALAKTAAEVLAASEPALVVSTQNKGARAGKVLIDWSQNDRHKTTIGVYSLRALSVPSVSTPVTWDEVQACVEAGDADRLRFGPAEVLARVDEFGDLFDPALSLRQRLPNLSDAG